MSAQRAVQELQKTAEYLTAKADRRSGEVADALRQAAEMVALRATCLARPDPLADLRERLVRGAQELSVLADNSQRDGDPLDVIRLRGKVEGVKFALSYVDEALQTAQPDEETR